LIDMFKSALVLAVLGAIDSLLTSLVADNMTRSFHDSNRELIGQGIGNTVAGLFGGLPGAGATMRTVVNIRSGGSSPISGALHAVLLLALALGAGSVAEHIPHAVLAGILIKVGVDIIDWNFMIHLRQTTLTSTLLMLVVLLVTVFVDLITAVGVGVVVASLLLVQRMADLQMISSQLFSSPKDAAPLSPQERELLGQAQGKILLYHLSGPLSFGAARDMVKRVAGYQSHQVLLLDLTDVPLMDYTSARAIGDIIRDNESAAKQVYLVGLHPSLESLLQKTKILDSVLLEHRYACRYDALQHALKNNIGSGRV
jgi:SulP family sulfate permease